MLQLCGEVGAAVREGHVLNFAFNRLRGVLTYNICLISSPFLSANLTPRGLLQPCRLKVPCQGNEIWKTSLLAKQHRVHGQNPATSNGLGGACSPATMPRPLSGSLHQPLHLPLSEVGTDLRLSQPLKDIGVPLWLVTPWKGKGESRPN